jgi:hypothetical protein
MISNPGPVRRLCYYQGNIGKLIDFRVPISIISDMSMDYGQKTRRVTSLSRSLPPAIPIYQLPVAARATNSTKQAEDFEPNLLIWGRGRV